MAMTSACWFLCVTAVTLVSLANCQLRYPGDACKLIDGRDGVCKSMDECETVKAELQQGKRPTICMFQANTPIACCPQPKMGKTQKMCNKYGEYVFERIRKPVFVITQDIQFENRSRCEGGGGTFVIGGEEAKPKEFPHMALIGYGEKNDISWLCGGSLISLRYVMTAGHCLKTNSQGAPRWVRVGDLNIKLTTERAQPQDFAIERTFPNPLYKPPAQYNDIALLKLEKDVEITDYVRPACLHWQTAPSKKKAIASGWGRTDWANSKGSDMLMKVRLNILPTEECSKSFESLKGTRKLREGITEDNMVCAGELKGKKDTCQGDSGGPLQFGLDKPYCMYSIYGVTSFGASVCGSTNTPAVYTRVSKFLPWIESIVWPDDV